MANVPHLRIWLNACVLQKKHLEFSIRWKGDKLGVFEMRRHYTNYFKGINDFKPFRMRLVEAPTEAEATRSAPTSSGENTLSPCLMSINDVPQMSVRLTNKITEVPRLLAGYIWRTGSD